MARNNPSKAYVRYFDALQAAVGCITHGRLVGRTPMPPQPNKIYALALNGGDPLALQSNPVVTISGGQWFRIIEDPDADSGPFRATTVEYWYQFALGDGTKLLTFHWTPETDDPKQRKYPHLHIENGILDSNGPFKPEAFSKFHVPTARISIEAIVRFAIEELSVEPVVTDWERVLRHGEDAFGTHSRRSYIPRRWGRMR